jgi:hypothetical protein
MTGEITPRSGKVGGSNTLQMLKSSQIGGRHATLLLSIVVGFADNLYGKPASKIPYPALQKNLGHQRTVLIVPKPPAAAVGMWAT